MTSIHIPRRSGAVCMSVSIPRRSGAVCMSVHTVFLRRGDTTPTCVHVCIRP